MPRLLRRRPARIPSCGPRSAYNELLAERQCSMYSLLRALPPRAIAGDTVEAMDDGQYSSLLNGSTSCPAEAVQRCRLFSSFYKVDQQIDVHV
jgi:hypothetical protein